MNEERRMILEMLRDGGISVEEAERLMAALTEEKAQENLPALSSPILAPKRILVRCTEGGKNKVNIKVPFSLVRAGLKLGKTFGALGAKYVKDEDGAMALELLKDVDIDELLASISDGEITLPYTLVDIVDDEKGEAVQVMIE